MGDGGVLSKCIRLNDRKSGDRKSLGLSHYQLISLLFVLSLFSGGKALADNSAADMLADYDIYNDISYLNIENVNLMLDVYKPRSVKKNPVLVYFHGGGWVSNTRHSATLRLIPFLQKGFTVVNVSYRKIDQAQAPAAVVDASCSLRWLALNAERFGFDLDKVVLSGNSAGGHLAMMAAYSNRSGLFDGPCWNGVGPKIAAVVNWYGISDVEAMLADGLEPHAYAIQWIGNAPDTHALAKRVSPIHYVSSASSPTISIHGTKDAVVSYQQSFKLHEQLAKAKVTQQLVTITEKGHGEFDAQEYAHAYDRVWDFLSSLNLMPMKL